MQTTLPTASPSLRRALAAPPFGVPWSVIGFAARNTAASFVALWIALRIGLEEPKWAAMTVWIVAQGSRGMSLSKSQYRLAGTIVGAAMALVLLGAFAQAPELFFLALALWLGVCVALSTALRNFRSYGAVLAGYTAAIIGVAGASAPGDAFDIAVARVVYISLGILVEAVFSAVFAPGRPIEEIAERLDVFLRQSAAITARALRGADNSEALTRLFADAVALDAAGEYAAAGSRAARRRLGHLRGAVAATLAALAAAQSLREARARGAAREEPLLGRAAETFEAEAKAPGGGALEAFGARLRASEEPAPLRDRLELILIAAEAALRRRALLSDPDAPASRIAFRFHFDPLAALLNAVRGFVAVLAAAAFWIATAWPNGGSVVVIVAVVCTLFATRQNAAEAGLGFLKGAAVSLLVAAPLNFALLPAVSGFPMLVLIVAPVIFLGGVATRLPATAAPATAFTLFLWDLIGPDNATRVDVAGFLNGAVALLLGIACGALVFTLLRPMAPGRTRARLHAAVRRDLRAIGRDPGHITRPAWLSRMADRFSLQLVTNAGVPDAVKERELRGMLAALTIGHAVLSLRALDLGAEPGAARMIAAVARRLGDGAPERLAWLAGRAAARFGRAARRPGADRRLARAAVLFEDVSGAAAAHADFLKESPR